MFLQYPKNPKVGPIWRTKRGAPFGFFNISLTKHQNNEGGHFEVIKKFSKKGLNIPKQIKKPTMIVGFHFMERDLN